ncbi:MAG: TonB-dependent receptor plug domain-containing protein [Marinilabiliaceae bacterium]|nr:TonB-dependent receptor plug domain-containing protein [Marinilabiliaceae bacterium]
MKIFTFLIILLLLNIPDLHSQTIQIESDKPLNKILNELIIYYDINLSFDDDYTSEVLLKAHPPFQSLNTFFAYLEYNHPIKIDTIGNNIVVHKKHTRVINREYLFRGKIYDATTGCGLPHSELLFNGYPTISAANGQFTYKSDIDSLVNCSVRHLGYHVLDTVIMVGSAINLALHLNPVSINDVIITKNRLSTHNANLGVAPGLIKLNPVFTKKLPGYGETSLYSFMRLMPGILATGEDPGDVSIRGSLEGQNKYIFNHYRVYEPWYKLNEIGTINPLLIKGVEVYKGGYDASKGENIGGLVKFTGSENISSKIHTSIFVNNFIVNGKLEMPLSDKLSFVLAGRKNISNKINKNDDDENLVLSVDESGTEYYSISTEPEYELIDGNLKFNYKVNEQNQFSLAAFGSIDNISLVQQSTTEEFLLNNYESNQNKQQASSLSYLHTGKKGDALSMSISYSGVKNEKRVSNDYLSYVDYLEADSSFTDRVSILDEFHFHLKHQMNLDNGSYIDCGIGTTYSHVKNNYQTTNYSHRQNNRHQLSYLFANYHVNITPNFNTNVGCRINYSDGVNKFSYEPRLLLNYYFNDNWKIYGSTGLYNQYIYKTYKYDAYQNSIFRWTSASETNDYNSSTNSCLGGRYAQNAWTVSLEYFYKSISTNVLSYNNSRISKLRYTGWDVLVKYQTERVTTWCSATISNLKEKRPSYNYDKTYSKSSYNMNHEIKWAGTYSLNKFTFSANYIYGSGFKLWHDDYFSDQNDYKRLDIGTFYQHKISNVLLETGISLLNVLNTKNRKLDEFTRFGVGENVISYPIYGLKRTPTFYIKISL